MGSNESPEHPSLLLRGLSGMGRRYTAPRCLEREAAAVRPCGPFIRARGNARAHVWLVRTHGALRLTCPRVALCDAHATPMRRPCDAHATPMRRLFFTGNFAFAFFEVEFNNLFYRRRADSLQKIGVAWASHGRRMGVAWASHGRRMAAAAHGPCMVHVACLSSWAVAARASRGGRSPEPFPFLRGFTWRGGVVCLGSVQGW